MCLKPNSPVLTVPESIINICHSCTGVLDFNEVVQRNSVVHRSPHTSVMLSVIGLKVHSEF